LCLEDGDPFVGEDKGREVGEGAHGADHFTLLICEHPNIAEEVEFALILRQYLALLVAHTAGAEPDSPAVGRAC
jgi:predicted RNA polymerase sigma factor